MPATYDALLNVGARFGASVSLCPELPHLHTAAKRLEIWLKGLLAAAISGGAGGVLTGLAAVGIDPTHFNLQAGIGSTVRIGLAAAVINAIVGVAAYLQKSPLPEG